MNIVPISEDFYRTFPKDSQKLIFTVEVLYFSR